MKGWAESTFIAWENQRGVCPICNVKIRLLDKEPVTRMVGHHLVSRQYGDHSPENCEARHADCEVWAHRNWKDGNPK